MRMAATDAPHGRALRDTDLIEVRVVLPRHGGPEHPVERRRWLLADVVEQVRRQGGAPTVLDLAAIAEVSEATIRRDLAVLREQGRVVATRGARLG